MWPQTLCILARALVRLKHSPGLAWRQAFEQRVRQVLAAMPDHAAAPLAAVSKAAARGRRGEHHEDGPPELASPGVPAPLPPAPAQAAGSGAPASPAPLPASVPRAAGAAHVPLGAAASDGREGTACHDPGQLSAPQEQHRPRTQLPSHGARYDSRVWHEADVLRRALQVLGVRKNADEGLV